MELVVVWGTGHTENSVAYLENIRIIWVQLISKSLKFLTNLTNLLSRILGKKSIVSSSKRGTRSFMIRWPSLITTLVSHRPRFLLKFDTYFMYHILGHGMVLILSISLLSVSSSGVNEDMLCNLCNSAVLFMDISIAVVCPAVLACNIIVKGVAKNLWVNFYVITFILFCFHSGTLVFLPSVTVVAER